MSSPGPTPSPPQLAPPQEETKSPDPARRSKRKRRPPLHLEVEGAGAGPCEAPSIYEALGAACRPRVVVVSGAGLSVAAGLATFSGVGGGASSGGVSGGLYARAAKDLGVNENVAGSGGPWRLFSHCRYRQRPCAFDAFFARLGRRAARLTPTAGHRALARLSRRESNESPPPIVALHVTLNVDGLSTAAGETPWRGERKVGGEGEGGSLLELHGRIRESFCPTQGCRWGLDEEEWGSHVGDDGSGSDGVATLAKPRRCPRCGAPGARTAVVLYGDPDAAALVAVPEGLSADAAADPLTAVAAVVSHCSAIVWVGVSFLQSATIEYGRALDAALPRGVDAPPFGRPRHVVVNPDPEAASRLADGIGDSGAGVAAVITAADVALPAWATAAAATSEEYEGGEG